MSGEASDMSLLMVYATVSLLAGQLLLTVLFHRMPTPWSDKPAVLAHHRSYCQHVCSHVHGKQRLQRVVQRKANGKKFVWEH